ncbi:hypothetical protein PDUR_02255 [Paenibacillus durus]|uniref:Uncharacterized protein n=1 Tax=Paenibacillus durus TaxID=44251 RepID=A0A089HGA3_PAEDU|nr:hypothetical protein PDUR_02255 [Paenibacillus durus]
MGYFKLYPDVKYSKGKLRSTLYLLGHGRTIHLTKTETEILEVFLTKSIEEVQEKLGEQQTKEILNYLLLNSIGILYKNNVYVEGYSQNANFNLSGYFEPPFEIDNLYIQLTNQCSMNCGFCGKEDRIEFQGCNSCAVWNANNSNDHNITDLIDGLDQFSNFKIKNIIFSGGNPFQEWNHLLSAIERIHKFNGSNIFIHCPPTTIDEKKLESLLKYNITLIFNVFDSNSGKEESNEALQKAVSISEKYNINYQFNLFITSPDVKDYESKLDLMNKFNASKIHNTEMINYGQKLPKLISSITGQDRVEDISHFEYFYRDNFNSCLNKKLAIAFNGDILPCPFINKKLGNIYDDEGINGVVKNNLHKEYWERTKSSASLCANCENRYGCIDCVNLELKIEENEDLKEYMCTYDPELSRWINEKERSDFAWNL